MTFSLLVAATLVSSLLIGLIPTLIDGVHKSLKARLNPSDGQIDWFGRLFYLVWLPAMPGAGWMLDHWHNKEILLYGLVLLILGTAWLALVRSFLSLMGCAVLLGFGYSCVAVAAVSFMPVVFFPAYTDHYQLNIASLNLGFIAVGAGALIGPWLVPFMEKWWGFRQGMLYLSVALLAPAALTSLCDRNQFPTSPSIVANWAEVFTHPQMALIIVVILLYFVLENYLEFWPEAYLTELGYQGKSLQASMLIFWLAFIAMRGAAAWWFYEHPSHAFGLTIVFVFLSAMILGNLSGGFEMGSGSLGFWILGACYGPLLPGFLGMALELYPQAIPVSILGVLLALSGFDTLVMRPLMNIFGKDRPARTIMRGPAFIAIILMAPLLLLAFAKF